MGIGLQGKGLRFVVQGKQVLRRGREGGRGEGGGGEGVSTAFITQGRCINARTLFASR